MTTRPSGLISGVTRESHTDLELLDGRITAVSAAAIVAAGGIGPGFADEQAGLHRVGSLDSRALQDAGAAVTGEGPHDDIEIVAPGEAGS